MTEIVQRAGDPKGKAASVRLEIHGDAKGQALLLLPWHSALRLMDLLMETPLGTTTDIRFEERTALAEVGCVRTDATATAANFAKCAHRHGGKDPAIGAHVGNDPGKRPADHRNSF